MLGWDCQRFRRGKPVVRALSALPPESLKGKRCAGISVCAVADAEITVKAIGEMLMQKGCEDYRDGPVAKAGIPLSLWKGPSVIPEDEELFKAFGAGFVK